MTDKRATDGPGREPEVTVVGDDGVAFVTGEVLVRGEPARRRLWQLLRREGDFDPEWPRERTADGWARTAGADDVVSLVEVLRAEGHVAQPNHVFPAHSCGSHPCGPHPAVAWQALDGRLDADPFRSNPFRSNPFRSNPFRSNPFRSNPYRSNPFRSNAEPPHSSAVPAAGRRLPGRPLSGTGHPRIAVLDTGLAQGAQLPSLLSAGTITGDPDHPDVGLADGTSTGDGFLDPVAGHGTFIAGLIEQLAPGCSIRLPDVVTPLGLAVELELADLIEAQVALPPDERPHIISLSLGGPVLESPFLLRSRIAEANLAGIVVVASAGNDATCTPYFPAALPGVVAVGAVGPDGPAPFTNYGPWVDACAPGVDLVSAFFQDFDGAYPLQNSIDPDAFAGWAAWSGTSFAAPVVVAALAREMVQGSCSAQDAVERVVRAPHLARVPCLGTVVNL